MSSLTEPKPIPHVKTKWLANLGLFLGIIAPILFCLGPVIDNLLSLSALASGFIVACFISMFVSFCLFIYAFVYEAQKYFFNKKVKLYSITIDNSEYLEKLLTLHIQHVFWTCILTLILFPIVLASTFLLFLNSGLAHLGPIP